MMSGKSGDTPIPDVDEPKANTMPISGIVGTAITQLLHDEMIQLFDLISFITLGNGPQKTADSITQLYGKDAFDEIGVVITESIISDELNGQIILNYLIRTHYDYVMDNYLVHLD